MRWKAIEEKTRVQRIRRVALREIQGKPAGPVISNVLLQAMPNYIARRSWRVGGESETGLTSVRCCSERKPAGQLNLAASAGGAQDLPYVSGKITRCILEDGIPVTCK